MDVRFTRAKNLTYMGRAAKSWEALATSNKVGERVAFTRWVEDATEANGGHTAGTIVAAHITGDGTKRVGFVKFAEQSFTGEHAEDVATAWALERLTGRSIDGIDCTPPSGC